MSDEEAMVIEYRRLAYELNRLYGMENPRIMDFKRAEKIKEDLAEKLNHGRFFPLPFKKFMNALEKSRECHEMS